MPNFGENTREFLQFPIYYYDVVYSRSLPVRGYAGCASVLVNAWDPIAVAPALLNVDASGNLKITGAIAATTSAVATAAAPTYIEGSTNALSMDLAGNVRTTGAAGSGLTDAQLRATPVPISGTAAVTNAGLTNLDVALSTRTKPADQQHVIVDSSAAIAVTGPLTDTQLRATAVPVSGTVAVTGTFFQATQPVSLASIPNEPNMDVPLSSLIANQMLQNTLMARQLAAVSAGAAGFVPMETPSFLAGFGY